MAIVSAKDDAAAVAIVFMNTILGGAGGAIAALGVNWVNYSLRKGKIAYWSLLTCINGGLAGMVALCAGCNVLHPGAAFAIGIIGGFTMYWVSNVLKRLGVDDPLGKLDTEFDRQFSWHNFEPFQYQNSNVMNGNRHLNPLKLCQRFDIPIFIPVTA